MRTALVFGATGALGSAVVDELRACHWVVVTASRGAGTDINVSQLDWVTDVVDHGLVSAIVWAQGANDTGGALETTSARMHELFDANVVFITDSLRALADVGALTDPARGIVLSSIWQITARANKLAYVASKSALGGVIPALAADLSSRGISINAVLPGVIDTPMTRQYLTSEQIDTIESQTPTGRLSTAEEVARVVAWLADERSSGVNGQWISVDGGWSVVRSV